MITSTISSSPATVLHFAKRFAQRHLALAAAALTLTAATAATADPETLGVYKDWLAYSVTKDDAQKVCYIVSEPTEKLPRNVNHGNVYFLISNWPARNVKSEPSFLVGYDFKENSNVTLEIGGDKWQMFTFEQGAWIQNGNDEKNLIDAMRRGSSMRLKATSGRGTATEYRISLSGVSAALDKLAQSCN